MQYFNQFHNENKPKVILLLRNPSNRGPIQPHLAKEQNKAIHLFPIRHAGRLYYMHIVTRGMDMRWLTFPNFRPESYSQNNTAHSPHHHQRPPPSLQPRKLPSVGRYKTSAPTPARGGWGPNSTSCPRVDQRTSVH